MTASHLMRRAAPLAVLVGLAGFAAAAQAQTQAPRRDSLTLYELPDYRGASVTFYGDNANIGSTGFTTRAQSAQVVGSWRLCTGGGYRNRCEIVSGNVRDLGPYGLSRQVGSAQRVSRDTYAAAPSYDTPRYDPPAYPPAQTPPRSGYAAPAERPGYAAPPADPYAPGYRPPSYGGQYGAPAAPYTPSYGAPRDDYAAPRPGYDQDARDFDDAPAALDAPYRGAPAPSGPSYAATPERGVEGRSSVFFPRPVMGGRSVPDRAGAAEDFCRSQGLGRPVYFDMAGGVLGDVLCVR